MKKHFFLMALWASYASAQTDSIALQEVILSDPFMQKHAKSQAQINLNDSIIKQNHAALSQVLQFESPVYIKENGLGMVASPAFRGTTASQTAVIWNGININSSINGQTDFSMINSQTYDKIAIKPGGGSMAYGTGAIGGSIHLMDEFKYDQRLSQKLDLSYGSYNSYQGNYQLHFAKKNFLTNVGFARFQSDNDYKINNHLGHNQNGKYYINTIDANTGFKFNHHELRVLSQFNFGKREFSLSDVFETPTMYENQDYRIMGEWMFKKNKWNSNLKLAYTYEANQFSPNKNAQHTQDLQVSSWIAKYYLSYSIAAQQSLSAFAEHLYNEGEGTNLIQSNRNSTNFGLIYKHQVSAKFDYEASLRQDFSDTYHIPLVYAIGLTYQPFQGYKTRFNFSKNYRIPTFNDLFWQTGGNPDLKAENALQFEWGNDFRYKNLNVQTNLYWNDITDMIQWIPGQGSAYWEPVNRNKVKTYGAEIIGNFNWNRFNFKAIYTYTRSINQETDLTLMYVPKHQFNWNINYTYKHWNIYLQNRWVDQVYTQSDNQKSLPSYWTSNLGLGYIIHTNLEVNGTIKNVFNQPYQSVENRWMPGINYQISLHIKL